MSSGVRMPDDGSDRANVVVTCIGFVLLVFVMWMADHVEAENARSGRPGVGFLSSHLD